MESSKYIFPVGIDMGAKYTGVFMLSHLDGVLPTAADATAMTIVNSDKIHYSMKHRTAVRHRVRSKKRFVLARRLLNLIVDHQLMKAGFVLSAQGKSQLTEALSGYLKRRGYSRIETEIDLDSLNDVDPIVFAMCPGFEDFFSSDIELLTQWNSLTADLSEVNKINSNKKIPDVKTFKKYVKDNFPDYSSKESLERYLEARKTIIEAARQISELTSLGHLHREKYLDNILHDMGRDSRLKKIGEAFGGICRFWNLIGNLSNLQLRALRWYFNDPWIEKVKPVETENSQPLNEQKLKDIWVRAYKYFHPDPENKARISDVIRALSKADDIIDCLCELDCKSTIPPYEDQNNRRPPLDYTLYLNPAKLTEVYGDSWRSWASRLVNADSDLQDNLDVILQNRDRKSRRTTQDSLDFRLSYILQRALDRSKVNDIFEIRKILSSPTLYSEAATRNLLLFKTLEEQNFGPFLDFSRRYFYEVAKAQKGLWNEKESILERSDLHPKQKKKVLDRLVANVLRVDEETAKRFIADVWNGKVKGNSTVKSICTRIEQLRKDRGSAFNLEYQSALTKAALGNEKLDSEEKEYVKLKQDVSLTAAFIGEQLGLSDEQRTKFANPFSLAQLYTIIETERSGFTKITTAALLENAWRLTFKNGAAQCGPLPADSVRPFDGYMRRVLERNAREVGKRLIEKIKRDTQDQGAEIVVPILVEENKFNFTASLLELKRLELSDSRLKKKQEKIEKAGEAQKKKWLSKEERIKDDAKGICAYTGAPLNSEGEVDHIIPRSKTIKNYSSIFNSEVNLIFVSRQGNAAKKENLYFLKQLNSAYLTAVFGTSDFSTIESKIESTVQQLIENKRLGYLDLLSQEERNCVRHALFLNPGSDARKEVLSVLGARRKTVVNGSQAWFIRTLRSYLENGLQNWLTETGNKLSFDAFSIPAVTVSSLRSQLGELENSMFKEDIQSVSSHSVDAMCVYAAACGDASAECVLHGDALLADSHSMRAAQLLKKLYPETCQVVQISPKSFSQKDRINNSAIFKDTIYAERFLNIYKKKEEVFVGFDNDKKGSNEKESLTQVKGKNPHLLLQILEPFFEKRNESKDEGTYRIDKTKAFQLMGKAGCALLSNDESRQLSLLNQLHYTTLKQEVLTELVDTASKKIKLKSKYQSNFKREFLLKLELRDRERQFSAKGNIVYPSYKRWQELSEELSNFLTACPEGGLEEVNARLSSLWTTSEKSSVRHKKVKRSMSLPMLASQSGAVRIRRKDFRDGYVYQSIDANQLYYGFSKKDGKILFNSPLPHPRLTTKNLKIYEYQYQPVNECVKMDEWKTVYEKEGVIVEHAPGTKARRYIRATLPFDLYLLWDKELQKAKDKSSLTLPSKVIRETKDFFEEGIYKNEELAQFFPKPRENNKKFTMNIELVGSTVKFSYVTA